MTNSQIETLNWYKEHGSRLDNIESKILLPDGTLKITTNDRIFIMGKRGSLTEQLKK